MIIIKKLKKNTATVLLLALLLNIIYADIIVGKAAEYDDISKDMSERTELQENEEEQENEAIVTYKVTVIDSKGNTIDEYEEIEEGSIVEIQAGEKNAAYFAEWEVIYGNIAGAETSSSTIKFTMPATDVIIKAKWNEITSITATFNSLFYDTYSAFYKDGSGYCIDSTDIIISKDMINVFIILDNGTELEVSSDNFEVANTILYDVGAISPVIRLKNIYKADGSAFECYMNVQGYSLAIKNIMSKLNINSYAELADYITALKSDYMRYMELLESYRSGMEEYREIINAVPGNEIVFTENDTVNIGKIENGITDLVSDLSGHMDVLKYIQKSLIDAGAEDKTIDGSEQTIMLQISGVVNDITDMENQISEIEDFVNVIKAIINIENPDSATLEDIYNKVAGIKGELGDITIAIKGVSDNISSINAILGSEEGEDISESIDNVIAGINGSKTGLGVLNEELFNISSQLNAIINGNGAEKENEAVTMLEEVQNMQSYIISLVEDCDKLYEVIYQIKYIFDVDKKASLDDVIEELEKIKEEYDIYSEAIADISEIVGTNKNEELTVYLKDLYNDVSGLKVRVETISGVLDELFKDETETGSLEEVRHAIKELAEELNNALEQVTELRKANTTKADLIKEQTSKIKELESQILEMKQSNSNKAFQIMSIEAQIGEFDAKEQQIKQEEAENDTIFAQLEIEENKKNDEIINMKQQISVLLEEINIQKQSMQAQIDNLTEQIITAGQLKADIESEKKAEIAELQETYKELEESSKHDITGKDEDITELTNKIANAAAVNNGLLANNTILTNEIEKLEDNPSNNADAVNMAINVGMLEQSKQEAVHKYVVSQQTITISNDESNALKTLLYMLDEANQKLLTSSESVEY